MPEPEGPMIETISPRGMVEADVVERDDVALAGELLGDGGERDHRGHAGRLCELFHNIVKFSEIRDCSARPTGRADQTPQVPPKPIVT